MTRIISEGEFREAIVERLSLPEFQPFGCVTGPGRSGAVAAVYASHILKIPFIPFGANPPLGLGPLLIIDTATQSGRTLRKATQKYKNFENFAVAIFSEPPRVIFWYENPILPQRYKHENP